jgi:peptide/nickel transport system substrate-binding protein
MRIFVIPISVLLLCSLIVIGGCSSSNTPAPSTTTQTAPAVSSTTVTTAAPITSAPSTTKPAVTAPVVPTSTATVSTPTGTAAIKRGGILRVIQESGPGTPIGTPFAAAGPTANSQQLVTEALFREDADGSINPRIALSMDIAPDGSSITVHLRKGVKFQDGTDLNAQAVKWDYDMVKSTGMFGTVSDYWKSVDVIDDTTLKINYTSWQNTDIKSLGENFGFFVSPTAYQKNGIDWMRLNLVGSGPFKMVDFQRDVVFNTAKFDQYWDTGKPYLDGVQYLFVADPLTRQLLFQSGGADILYMSAGGKTTSDLQNAGFTVVHKSTQPYVLAPDGNNADSPWSNVKVRQAAEYAIDKVSLASALGYGFKTPAYQLPTPSSTVYEANYAGRKYDVAKAKQLMTDAGFANGFKTTIILNPSAGERDVAVAVQSYLSKIGITADLEFPTASKYNDYVTIGWKNGLIMTGEGEWPNYNSVWGFYFDKNSNFFRSVYKPAELQKLIDTSLASIKPDKTLTLNVVHYLSDNAVVLPLFYIEASYVLQPYVKDGGFLERMFPIYWRPEQTWMNK